MARITRRIKVNHVSPFLGTPTIGSRKPNEFLLLLLLLRPRPVFKVFFSNSRAERRPSLKMVWQALFSYYTFFFFSSAAPPLLRRSLTIKKINVGGAPPSPYPPRDLRGNSPIIYYIFKKTIKISNFDKCSSFMGSMHR